MMVLHLTFATDFIAPNEASTATILFFATSFVFHGFFEPVAPVE